MSGFIILARPTEPAVEHEMSLIGQADPEHNNDAVPFNTDQRNV